MRAPRWIWTGVLAGGCLAATGPSPAQEIIQAQVLDLTVVEVQVIVTGAAGTDEVRCLLRDQAGQSRLAATQRVVTGAAAGRTTVVSVPLGLVTPHEREFSVILARGDQELDRTPWRPLPR